MRVSENDFTGWWSSPVGQEVRLMLMERIQRINDTALNDAVIRDPIEMGKFLGRKLEALDLLNMSYKEFMGEE